MVIDYKGNKSFRILNIYERLNKGELLSKAELAADFSVGEKTIQRDIDDLRAYLAEQHQFEKDISIKYDRKKNGYYLIRMEREWVTNEEVLAICKILLESRAFRRDEIRQLTDKLLMQVAPKDRKTVETMISNELFHYIPLRHDKPVLSRIWELSQAIISHSVTEISYERKDGVCRTHLIKPVSIMFSEYYFYLIGFMADGSKTLPTAVIEERKDNMYKITADVYGDGIYMWLRSQGDKIILQEG